MILFVFEGARREPMLFESIKYLFFEKETDTIVYSFGNNIYNLYKQIMENDKMIFCDSLLSQFLLKFNQLRISLFPMELTKSP